jgi:hypothetical protein
LNGKLFVFEKLFMQMRGKHFIWLDDKKEFFKEKIGMWNRRDKKLFCWMPTTLKECIFLNIKWFSYSFL